MGIYGNISVVILDNDAVSVAAVPACACIGNCSACGSVNGRAIGSCYVDALVVSSVALVGGDISAVNRPYIFARTACGDELGSVVGNIGSLCCAYSDYLGNRLLNNNRINGLFLITVSSLYVTSFLESFSPSRPSVSTMVCPSGSSGSSMVMVSWVMVLLKVCSLLHSTWR